MTDSQLERLAELDACAVSDAMDRLGRPAVALGLRALSGAGRIVGRAVTVQLGPANGRTSARHLCTSAVEAAGPGQIIVVAHNGREDVAGWGGILSLAAWTRGLEGVVIDGACRDIDESREMGLPVYARAAVPVTARTRVVEVDWNVPVQISGVTVAPDDLVIADGSGVVVIPAELAEGALAAAEKIVAKERRMAEDVLAGRPVGQVMGADYESMLAETLEAPR